MIRNHLLDNSDEFKMDKMLVDLISKIPQCKTIKIATGFWDIPGLALVSKALKEFLSREGTKLQLLIGTDLRVKAYQLTNPTILPTSKFPEDFIKREISELQVTDEYIDAVKLLLDYCTEDEDSSKIQIRIFRTNHEGDAQFLHAKCYIFQAGNYSCGIVGSSNFTKMGLTGNAELNHLETDPLLVEGIVSESISFKSYNHWFEEKWETSTAWNRIFLEEVLRPSNVGKAAQKRKHEEEQAQATQLTPYEVYIKYLQLQFGDMIDAQVSTILKDYLPADYNPLEFQLDAVKQCFSIMKRYGGFLLGDVVGLGKTIVGVLLIKYFLDNADSLGRERKVLIIAPPAIKSNWEDTINAFDADSVNKISPHVTIVTTGSIDSVQIADIEENDVTPDDSDQLNIHADAYGLILIDESHGFRNSETQKYKAVDNLIGLINPTPYVALLSATPQNNSPRDIYNQIKLFQRETAKSTLPGVPNGRLDSFFANMERRYREARNMPQDSPEQQAEARRIISEVSEEIRKNVLNEVVVRRTRADIKRHYEEDATTLRFPQVKGPHKLEYEMTDELKKLFADTITAICPQDRNEQFNPNKHIGFARYATITQFVSDANKKLYEKRNLTVDSITSSLQRIMRILLVKRLESSIPAFKTTLSNLRRYNEVMIDMLLHDCVYICPDEDVNKRHADSDGDFKAFQATMDDIISRRGGNNRKFKASDFHPDYIEQLRHDSHLIGKLLERWNRITLDPKFERFRKAVKEELFDPKINNPSGKNAPRLVIFTEALDTLKSISAIMGMDYKVLEVSAANRKEMQQKIRANFDANCPVEEQRDDYNVIVTTEVLAEGVNLHRANVILNYDAPWNATRLMQRIGRINRIGSPEEAVHVFNFFPSAEGNKQIRLIEKAYAKLQSFHEMFGEDSKVFSEREQLCEHDMQIMVDGEESPFGQYITELKAYRDTNPTRYDYLASLNPRDIGGTLQNADGSQALFVFTDDTHSFVSVTANAGNERGCIISPLATMETLKCDPSAQFDDTQLPDQALVEKAQHAYNQHVAPTSGGNNNRNRTEALGILHNLRNTEGLSMETLSIIKKIENICRNNDTFVINKVRQFNLNTPSLFGTDDDLNAIITAAFANFATRARCRRGESYLAIYEIN